MENGAHHEPSFPHNPLMEGGGTENADHGYLGDPNDLVGSAGGSNIYPPSPSPPPPPPPPPPLTGQGAVLHARGSDLSHMGSAETIDLEAPIAVDGSQPNDSAFTVYVTSPVRETSQGKLKGVQDSYYTYLINTSTTLTSYSSHEMSSRRRFRDFVDLSKLLRENYRGYFVPPRPHRNMYQGKIRMSPTFIEQRRKALEKYLKQLTAHPVISRSQELRVFLEARGQMRECMDWIRLHPISPPWYEGAIKLIRQLSGKERSVPSTTEVAQPVNAKRDILRSMKEGIKSFKEKRAPTIHGGKEQILRSETETMQDFKANVDNTWKWASYWMDRVEAVGRGFDGLGISLNALHAFEAQNGFVKITGPEGVGQGCTRTAGLHRQFVNQSAIPLSHLYDYSELMVSVLKALQTREDALNTVTTLKHDLAVKRGKLTNLQTNPEKDRQVAAMISDIAALESSITAAQSSYDRISAHNTQEMTRLRGQRQLEWYDMLRGLANSQKLFATYMRDVWCQVASDLGADNQVLDEIRGQSY